MLKPVKKAADASGAGARFAIIASQYNAKYVDGMLRAAQSTLLGANVADCRVIRVPGAFEIPVVAAQLASAAPGRISAVICLGVILRGETTHAQHIGEGVSSALALIQVRYRIPVIHEVLLLENEAQAQARCLDAKHNRGAEAAATALEMARIMKRLARDFPPAAVG